MAQKCKNTIEENEDHGVDDAGQSKRSKGAAGNVSCQVSSSNLTISVNYKKILLSDSLREVAKV